MTFSQLLLSGLRTIGGVVGLIAIVAAVEAILPRRRRGAWHRSQLGPNLALTVGACRTPFVSWRTDGAAGRTHDDRLREEIRLA